MKTRPNIFITALLAAFLFLLVAMVSACVPGPEAIGAKDKTGALAGALSSTATRAAAHIEAAKTAVSGIQLSDSARLATVGNLDAALAGLPRPTVDDLAFVAGLKTIGDYQAAAKESERLTSVAKTALEKAQRDLDAMREGREQDRRDGDARLWRFAAVGLFVAGAVTGYLFKDAGRSAILALSGMACAVLPVFLDKAGDALRIGAWALPVIAVGALVWLGRKLWMTEPVKSVDKGTAAPAA